MPGSFWPSPARPHRLKPVNFDPKLPFAFINETSCDSVYPLKIAALLRAGINCHARKKVR